MDQSTMRTIMSDTKIGQLREVLNVLKKNKLSSENALNIVICCCTACINAKDSLCAEDLISLMKICTKQIRNLNDELLKSYLMSLYYIVKYFVEQGDVKAVKTIEFMLMPTFMTDSNIVCHKSLYLNICALIHNKISQLSSKCEKARSQDFFDLCTLCIKMYFRVSPGDILKDKIYHYYKCYSFHEVDVYSQYNSYLYVLSLMQEKQSNILWTDEIYRTVVNVLIILTKTLFNGNYYCKIKEVIYNTVTLLKANYNGSTSHKIISIMKFITIIVSDEESYLTSNELVNTFSVCTDSLKDTLKLNKLTAVIQSSCTFHYATLLNVTKTYKTFSSSFWENNMNEEVQVALYQLIRHLSDVFYKAEMECPCRKCGGVDLISSINSLLLSGYVFSDYLANKSELSKRLLYELKPHLEQLCGHVAELKSRGCVQWENAWKDVGTMMYNICIKLYKVKSEKCCEFFKLFVKHLIQFEGHNQSVIKENILGTCLDCLTSIYKGRKNFGNVLITSALHMYWQPGSRGNSFLHWVEAKSTSRESTNASDALLQTLNMANVLVKYESFVTRICPNFKVSKSKKQELLLYELQQYKAIWPSKISIASVLKEIYLLADIKTASKAIIQVWDIFHMHKHIDDLLNDVLKKYELHVLQDNKCNEENNTYLAYLYFIKFNLIRDKMQEENGDDMQKTAGVSKQKEPSNEQTNSNDECDIMSSYECLKLDRHSQVMKHLHKSLNTFAKCTSPKTIGLFKQMNVYAVLKEIGFEYRLQCYTLEYFQALFLCLKIARLFSNNFYFIECVGYIIEKLDTFSSSAIELLRESDEIILSSTAETTEEWDVLANYYISKSTAYFLNGDVHKSLQLYTTAKDACENCSSSKNKELLEIRLNFLLWRHVLLPCDFDIKEHCENALVRPMLILSSIREYFSKNDAPHCPYFMTIFLEIHEAVISMFVWLRLPRETRCYCKEMAVLTQALVIPLQVVKFLQLLAQADLMSCRYDDCQVKINDMCGILGLSKQKSSSVRSEAECCKIEIRLGADALANEFQEMMLDVPANARRATSPIIQTKQVQLPIYVNNQATSGSPVLETEEFKLPSFINHDGSCLCLCCMSVNYQELVLLVINLCGQLWAHMLNSSVSEDYYNSALNVYNQIVSNENEFKKKISTLIHHDMFPSLENILSETYSIILLNIGNIFIGTPKFSRINKKLLTIVDSAKFRNTYIYNEAHLQLLNDMPHPAKKLKKLRELSPIGDVTAKRSPSRTPENRCSKVKVPVAVSPVVTSKKTIIKKSIKFSLSDDDEPKKDTNVKSTAKLYAVLKTPDPSFSGVQIYTPKTVKARKKKSALNMDTNHVPSKENVSKTCTELSTTSHSKTEASLKRSTRLLTEKLKMTGASTKAPLTEIPEIVVTNENDENCASGTENRDGKCSNMKTNSDETTSVELRKARNTVKRQEKAVENDNSVGSKSVVTRKLRKRDIVLK